jgi:stage II sporulation protein R
VYDTFSLPAGEYETLRVTIGAGAGRNWWCVIFPPLCADAATAETYDDAGLTEDEVNLITEADGEYAVRFKLAEVLGRLRTWLKR